MSKVNITAAGQALWAKTPKASAELFALTYGSLVMEIIRDNDNIDEVNTQLERIGHSIGVRCIDEFLSKSELAGLNIPSCKNMRETAEVIAKGGFKMFLGIPAEVANFSTDGKSFSLILYENPLSIFVEIPSTSDDFRGIELNGICYSNIYCGVIRGALESVNIKVVCEFVKDILKGDDVNEIRVEVKELLTDGAGDDYKEE
jgi:hypothetical protein